MATVYITSNEAAKRCHVTPYTMRRWIREGKMPAMRIGRRYLIDEEVIDSFDVATNPNDADAYVMRLIEQLPPMNREQLAELRNVIRSGGYSRGFADATDAAIRVLRGENPWPESARGSE